MGYGNKGWFSTYIQMMCNSFNYASNSVSRRQHWIARAFSILFAIIWHIVTIVIFIGIPVAAIIALVILII